VTISYYPDERMARGWPRRGPVPMPLAIIAAGAFALWYAMDAKKKGLIA
jgi:hypothetical protein